MINNLAAGIVDPVARQAISGILAGNIRNLKFFKFNQTPLNILSGFSERPERKSYYTNLSNMLNLKILNMHDYLAKYARFSVRLHLYNLKFLIVPIFFPAG